MANLQESYEYILPVRDLITDYEALTLGEPSILQYIRIGSPCEGTKIEWMQDTLSEDKFTIATLGSDGNGTVFTVASTAKLKAGMILKFMASTGANKAGLAKIASIDSGTQFTITRDFGGSTLATLAVGDKFTATFPRAELSSAVDTSVTQQTVEYNYTEISDWSFSISETALATNQYGDANTIAYWEKKAMLEMLWRENRMIMHGFRSERTSSNPGTMGGLEFFMQNGNVESTGGALSNTIMNNALTKIFDNAGKLRPQLIMVLPPNQQAKASALNTSGSNPLSMRAAEATVTGQYVNVFTEALTGSRIPMVIDRTMPKDQIWLIDTNAVERCFLRNPTIKRLPITTDGQQYRMIMEHSLRVKNGKERFARITGLTI